MVANTTTTETRKARLYGRAWQVLIFKPAYTTNDKGEKIRDTEHDISIDVSHLRCTFQTEWKYNTQQTQMGMLVVYNLNAATEGAIIREGFQISISAGYVEGQYGEIFTGDIVQIIRNREDGVDYKLEIIAFRGLMMFQGVNYVRSTLAAGSTSREIVNAVAKSADNPLKIGDVSKNLNQQPLPRGKVLFGTPGKYLRDVCVNNDASYGTDSAGKVTIIRAADEIPESMCLTLTPATGLVGTPQYSDDGIHMQMLLDCRIKLNTLIKIDNEIIKKTVLNFDMTGAGNNQQSQLYQFDQDGEYQVCSIIHRGDTWGDTWFTEVIGIGRNGRLGLLTATQNASQSTR